MLKVKGHYTTKVTVNDTYTVELLDDGYSVDTLDYPSKVGKVQPPSGYTKDPEGARKHAQDYWF